MENYLKEFLGKNIRIMPKFYFHDLRLNPAFYHGKVLGINKLGIYLEGKISYLHELPPIKSEVERIDQIHFYFIPWSYVGVVEEFKEEREKKRRAEFLDPLAQMEKQPTEKAVPIENLELGYVLVSKRVRVNQKKVYNQPLSYVVHFRGEILSVDEIGIKIRGFRVSEIVDIRTKREFPKEAEEKTFFIPWEPIESIEIVTGDLGEERVDEIITRTRKPLAKMKVY